MHRSTHINWLTLKNMHPHTRADISQLRGTKRDEIAFAGRYRVFLSVTCSRVHGHCVCAFRSNVGKSSLLNALLNRPQGLAKVMATIEIPGPRMGTVILVSI